MHKQYLNSDLLRYLPGIAYVAIEPTKATIRHFNGKKVHLEAPQEVLMELLYSWLVPVRHSGDFKSIQEYNYAMDGLDEITISTELPHVA